MKSSTKAREINGQIFSIGSLLTYLAKITDTRKPRGIRYSLAKLCREDKPYGIADWAQMRSEWLIETLHLDCKHSAIPNMEYLYGESAVLRKLQGYVGLKPIKLEPPPTCFFRTQGTENRR